MSCMVPFCCFGNEKQEGFKMATTKQVKLKEQAYASNLKSRALSVLIYLIDRSNQELTCFPAIPTIEEQLHISISTVKRALRELVDAGYIIKDARFREKNRGQSSNLYTLMLQDGKMEGEKKDCSENGEGVRQALENSFDDNDKGKDGKTRKGVEGFRRGLGEVDVKHIGFGDMVREEGKTEKTGAVGHPLETPKTVFKQKKSLNTQENMVSNILDYYACKSCNCKSNIFSDLQKWIGLFLFRSPLFFRWTGEGVSLMPP